MNEPKPGSKPECLLLIGTYCPHCPQVLAALGDMIKQGEISRLTVVNIEQQPELAGELNIRSVPWIKLGDVELTGLHSLQELRQWAGSAGTVDGMVLYLNELLTTARLPEAIQLVKDKPEYLKGIMSILGNQDAKINVRVGIGVIMEELQGSAVLRAYLDQLGQLTRHQAAPVRSDAAHYLFLTGSPDAKPYLQALLNDDSAEVREIAEDGLAELEA